MKSFRLFAALGALFLAAACHDSPSTPVRPAALRLAAGNAQAGTVAQKLAIAPTFVVEDASGNPLAGVRVTVAVASGGGSVGNAPERSLSGPTPVGTWTLGPAAGPQTLAITVEGLAPLTVTATAAAGAPAKLVPLSAGTVDIRVGELVTPSPSVQVVDAFSNPIAGAVISVAPVNGGSATASATANDLGVATVSDWRVGTTPGQNALTLSTGSITTSFLANVIVGEPVAILVAGAPADALAGSVLSSISARVADKYGNTVPSQTPLFAVTAGGGSLSSVPAVTRADGATALPAWTLGKSAVTQSIHLSAGSLSTDVVVPIRSDYNIDVRFFGDAMTDVQRGWFLNAAARIRGAVIGDIAAAPVVNLDVATACGIPGLPIVNETVDDLLIFASVSPIDGPGKILAEAGPCVYRNASTGGYSVIGVMLFDSADMDRMARDNITQDVITHEMLHVVGIGTLWEDKRLLTGARTPNVTYWGAQGRQGCIDGGGNVTCVSSVPVENNGVLGTSDAHWREAVFGSELMTGYANVGGMPFSAMTIGSLGDIGYQVNLFAADPFRMPGSNGARANLVPGQSVGENWEKRIAAPVILGKSPLEQPTVLRRP